MRADWDGDEEQPPVSTQGLGDLGGRDEEPEMREGRERRKRCKIGQVTRRAQEARGGRGKGAMAAGGRAMHAMQSRGYTSERKRYAGAWAMLASASIDSGTAVKATAPKSSVMPSKPRRLQTGEVEGRSEKPK